MRKLSIFLTMVCVLWLPAGCGRQPEYTVCLVDVSRSITAGGAQAEFNAVNELVGRMRRADRLTIIPITGDAMSETPGHMLTLAAPDSRQPYDYDLVEFQANARKEIAKLEQAFAERPAKHTDILGSIAIAREELAAVVEDSQQPFGSATLYVFSDFIEDDRIFRFGSDAIIASAGELALRLRAESREMFPPAVRVRLVQLESSEFGGLSPARQRWIRAFWEAYLAPWNPRWSTIGIVLHQELR
jgi:hypothetical protein